MPTKIRLQRRGRKAAPYYHIVIADGRAPRDGKFIEKIGTYNPITQPADIQLNFDRALYWLQSGAQPTDTVRTILSFKGVLYKHHLLRGVTKGAHTEEQAEVKFQTWLSDKEAKLENLTKETELAGKDAKKKALEAEKLVKENRAQEIAAKRAAAVEAKVDAAKKEIAAKAGEDVVAEEVVAEETVAEAPVVEEAVEEAKTEDAPEEPVAEKPAEEAKTEDAPEESVADKPAEEAKTEEAPEEPVAEKPAEEAKTEDAPVEETIAEAPVAEEGEPETEKKEEA